MLMHNEFSTVDVPRKVWNVVRCQLVQINWKCCRLPPQNNGQMPVKMA